MDAENYEKLAFLNSEYGFLYIFNQLTYPDSWFYGKLLSLIYLIIERDIFFLQLLNIIAFLISIVISIKIKNKFFGESSIIYPFYFVALYPLLIQYTSLTLRESFFTMFLLLGILFIIKWYEKRNLLNFIFINIFFFINSLFYIAGILPLIIVWLYFLISFTKLFFKNITNINIKLFYLSIIIISILSLYLFYNEYSNFDIIYFDSLNNIINFEKWQFILSITLQGDARYPHWLIPNNYLELPFKLFVRFIYFLYSPFIWDISKISHVVGLFDGIFYSLFTYFIIKNYKNIIRNKLILFIFLLFILELFIFAFGTGNFGTGIRHRSKFLLLFIIFSFPYYPKIKFK